MGCRRSDVTVPTPKPTRTDQKAYDCTSLAPEVVNPSTSEPRKPHPWEYADGAIYLLREVSRIRPAVAEPLLPNLAQIVRASYNISVVCPTCGVFYIWCFPHIVRHGWTISHMLPHCTRHCGRSSQSLPRSVFACTHVRVVV